MTTATTDRAIQQRRKEKLSQMVRDRTISEAARVYGVVLYTLGKADDGTWWHAMGHRDWASYSTGKPDDETVRRRIAQLRAAGYVAQRPNGRRNPLYVFAPSPEQGSTGSDPTIEQGENAVDPTLEQGSSVSRPHTAAGLYADPTCEQGSKCVRASRVSSSEVVVTKQLEEDEEDDGGREQGRVAADAERLIQAHAVEIADAEPALRVYLRSAVPPSRQEGYTLGVLSVYQGGPNVKWATYDGSPVLKADRAAWIASALTSLLTDEEVVFGSERRGSLANLHSRLLYNLNANHDRFDRFDGAAVSGRGRSSRGPAGAARGSPLRALSGADEYES